MSYLSYIRSKIGSAKFICPAARIIIENDQGEILIIHRLDNGKMGIPAGAIEENESIAECIIREVWEETGLTIVSPVVIGISSSPERESVTYPNGDQVQYFTVEFYCNQWDGTLKVQDRNEIRLTQFVPGAVVLQQLPPNELSAFESLKYYRETGTIRVQ